MTPKEKAKELLESMSFSIYSFHDIEMGKYFTISQNKFAKQCALIAIDEILSEIIKYADNSREYVVENSNFWQEVKQEIEKL